MLSQPDPYHNKTTKPPRRDWRAVHGFVDIRLSNVIEGIFALALIAVAIAQISVYWNQASVMRDQLTLAYPPRLVVSHIAIYKNGDKRQPPLFAAQEVIEGTVWIVNVGPEIGAIYKVECFPYWGSGPLPSWPVYYDYHPAICRNMVIQDGVSLQPAKDQNTMRPGNVGVLEFSTIMPSGGHDDFYILGYVVYQDRLATRRALFFGRKYDRTKGYFVKVDNPGYEHEE
jgi:hypothetical protein